MPGRQGDIKRAKLVIKLERGPDFEEAMENFEKVRKENAEKAEKAKAEEEVAVEGGEKKE